MPHYHRTYNCVKCACPTTISVSEKAQAISPDGLSPEELDRHQLCLGCVTVMMVSMGNIVKYNTLLDDGVMPEPETLLAIDFVTDCIDHMDPGNPIVEGTRKSIADFKKRAWN